MFLFNCFCLIFQIFRINSLADFPSHYGLLVLRLKLEAKYGRVAEALQTSRNLIYFWRKTRLTECIPTETENLTTGDANGKTVENLLQTAGGRQLARTFFYFLFLH